MQEHNKFSFNIGNDTMTMDVTFDTITHIYRYRIYNESKLFKPFYKKTNRAFINQVLELHNVGVTLGTDGILQYGRNHRNAMYY